MKLWLITARKDLDENNDPWKPKYSKAFGFVVRAETEKDARNSLDIDNIGEECYSEYDSDGVYTMEVCSFNPWLDSDFSDCKELFNEGISEIILRSFVNV
jgi:hypothetical protein